jgi:hypothetical protein
MLSGLEQDPDQIMHIAAVSHFGIFGTDRELKLQGIETRLGTRMHDLGEQRNVEHGIFTMDFLVASYHTGTKLRDGE